ncbi:hypothetical protein AB0N17_24910 [Streptomyces sp. NPDC051133]|uniref:hypothetical protein n=1 Tax=Streptomyces sp. NPDC051133 TaxID=3155521 RepID=UPI00343EF960
MSSLWRVRVTHVTEDAVELALAAIHPDAGEPSGSAVFAMRLLADTDPQRLEREAGQGAYWDDEALRRYAGRVIAAVTVTGRRNLPFDEAAARRRIEEDLHSRGLDPAATAWQDAFLQEWGALWRDPERVPSAVLGIRLADPTWSAAATPGREWDTAAYG